MASANQHYPSVDWHSFEARPKNVLIKIKRIHFKFLGIRMQPNLYLIQSSLFLKHQTSKNRELKSEIRTFFLTSLFSYDKEVLEALL